MYEAAAAADCFEVWRTSKLPGRGHVFVTFCVVQKVTKKHARTCKKLPVASFCASETAETGRIANGCEQGDHVSRRRRSPATSIQIAGRYMIVAEVTGVHQVTSYAENCNFSGIAGNDLNRCEVPALQRKDLERTAKEQLHSLQTVG